MTSLQSQYLLGPPLACNTARARLGIDSINERFGRNCLLEDDNFGGGSVMMWGAISYALKPQLVHIPGNLNAARYRDEVLTPHMLPSMNLTCTAISFLQYES
jgi:hypothetical protein